MTAAERAARRDELRREYRERKARELDAHDEAELADELRAGRCACGCRQPLTGGAVRQAFIDQRHRQTHHRGRLQRAAEAAGVPPRLSLKALQEANGTSDRNGDAPTRRKRRQTGPRPGVSIYLPSLAAGERLASWLDALVQDFPAAGWPDELGDVLPAIERALARRRARA